MTVGEFNKRLIENARQYAKYQQSRNSMMEPVEINEYEYDLLRNEWAGPVGAAYNECWEYCTESGLIFGRGADDKLILTDRGKRAVAQYEEYRKQYIGG